MGIPLTDKPMGKNIWEFVTNKLKDIVNKWASKSLNLVGRLVLTKEVLQTIRIYMLSYLLAPIGVLQQIRKIQRDSLWGKREEKKKWALVAWDKFYKTKSHGGLGLHDLDILSKVFREKFWWKLIRETRNP